MRKLYPICIMMFACTPLLALAQTTPPSNPCDQPTALSPSDRLLHIRACSGLGSQRSTPWHLKLDVTLYDEKGANPTPSTVEYEQSADADKTTYTSEKSSIIVNSKAGSFYNEAYVEMPYEVQRILQDLLDPGPDAAAVDRTRPEVRSLKLGTNQLDCIMLSQPPQTNAPRIVPELPLGLFLTFCVQSGTTKLRLSVESGSVQIVRDAIGRFLGREVATQLRVLENGVLRASAKVSTLATFTPEATTFATDGLAEKKPGLASLASGVVAGNIISKVQPQYPVSARQRHVSGTVVMHAIIGTDGRVRELTPVTLPDPDLVVAALVAVREWRYKPYLLNGVPVRVDTTIVVNFSLN